MKERDELIASAHRFYDEIGYIPSVWDFSIIRGYPTPRTVKNHFKSWKNFIRSCDFPDDYRTKKDTETIYIGVNDAWNENYYTDLKNMNSHLQFIVQTYVDGNKINYDMIHNQLLVMFEWQGKMYCASFLNIYVEDYYDKIDIIKQVLKDMDITLINLNGKYRWWVNKMHKFFTEGELP